MSYNLDIFDKEKCEQLDFIKNLIGIDIGDLQNAINDNNTTRINSYSLRLRKACKQLIEEYKK